MLVLQSCSVGQVSELVAAGRTGQYWVRAA